MEDVLKPPGSVLATDRSHYGMVTFELHELLIFLLDPLKPHFYHICTGLRGSFSHGDIFMMLRRWFWCSSY